MPPHALLAALPSLAGLSPAFAAKSGPPLQAARPRQAAQANREPYPRSIAEPRQRWQPRWAGQPPCIPAPSSACPPHANIIPPRPAFRERREVLDGTEQLKFPHQIVLLNPPLEFRRRSPSPAIWNKAVGHSARICTAASMSKSRPLTARRLATAPTSLASPGSFLCTGRMAANRSRSTPFSSTITAVGSARSAAINADRAASQLATVQEVKPFSKRPSKRWPGVSQWPRLLRVRTQLGTPASQPRGKPK